jgi:hypothetical protein
MKIIKISEGAVLAMKEHATSLFYDEQRKSSFYFNWKYQTHFEEVIDQIIDTLPAIYDKQLPQERYDWFVRQCKAQQVMELDLVNVHSIPYGGLWWHAFYSKVDFESNICYIIWHFSYSCNKSH